MVARREVELRDRAHLAHELVLRPRGGGRVGQVGQRRQGSLQVLLDLAELQLELLSARRHAAHGLDLAIADGRIGRAT